MDISGRRDFLRQIDEQTPAELDRHLIVDNYITYKHAKSKAWLIRELKQKSELFVQC